MFENYSWHDKLPDERLEVYEPHVRLFFETMYERQMIWKRRFIEKRELDRNSQWQIKNILLDSEL